MLTDSDWLRKRYTEDGATMKQIAVELDCSYSGVRYALCRFGIPLRPRRGSAPTVFVGERYGRWTVLAEAERGSGWRRRYLCRCDCGTEVVVDGQGLTTGHSSSCGCRKAEVTRARNVERLTHGHTRGRSPSPTYISWQNMIGRCYHPSMRSFEHYGGRGVAVCDRWRRSFENFLADMGERPEDKTLDRLNVDGDYEPSNCRWATASEQQLNRR